MAQELLFVVRGDGGDKESRGIFHLKDRFLRNELLWEALEKAHTWGELRSLLPEGEFESLPIWFSTSGETMYVDEDGRRLFIDEAELAELVDAGEDLEELTIKATDPFVKGDFIADGDYPSFDPPDMDRVLPREFCRKYGKRAESMVSGCWWEFPEKDYPAMKKDLEKAGFSVDLIHDFYGH
jgi:hypothetical protein